LSDPERAEPIEPSTPSEWQGAVDAASALLCLESARQYGLVEGGPLVNGDRCREILAQGAARGFTPAPDAAERYVAEWQEACRQTLPDRST